MIVGIILLLIISGLHAYIRDSISGCDKARQLVAGNASNTPILKREVLVKNPVKNK